MVRATFDNLAKAIGGKLLGGDAQAVFHGVSTDSRKLRRGELFIALAGPTFDGHRFTAQARDAGAAGAIVARRPDDQTLAHWPLVVVDDTLAALGRLAAWHRSQTGATIVGLTGSAGKTTTKEMISHLLGGRLRGVKAPRSFNNAIGVPLTLLQLEPADRFGVIEIGTNAFGEVAALAAVARPDIGLITCIGDAHLERFGSRWGVAWEKGQLIAGLRRDGLAVLNADDLWCRRIASLAPCRVVTFGFSADADVRLEAFDEHDAGVSFNMDGQRFDLPAPGRHNAMNAAGAVAVARQFGLPMAELAERLGTFRTPPMRMEHVLCGSVTVIADEYNASPTSVAAALAEYRRVPGRGRKLLVLGDMLELGAAARDLHATVGKWAADAGLAGLWTVGPLAQHAARGAIRHGMSERDVRGCLTTGEACRLIPQWIEPDDTLLIKGSRGMSLERLLAAIEQRCGPRSGATDHAQDEAQFESYRATVARESLTEGAR